MSLIKTIKEKIKENASLKDIKHIVKRQKEGKALANFNRWAEELVIKKMLSDGKSTADVLTAATEANGFELKWNEKRLVKLASQATKEKDQSEKEKARTEKKAAKEKDRADKKAAKEKVKADKTAAKVAKKAEKAKVKEEKKAEEPAAPAAAPATLAPAGETPPAAAEPIKRGVKKKE